MRTPIVAGNWKMNKTTAEAVALVSAIREVADASNHVETVVAPTFTSLAVAGEALKGSSARLAGQNMHWETSGAFTGEVSPAMLLDVGCSDVIIAHSERRQFFGETNESANRKLRAAHAAGLRPIYCVGETLDQRQGGVTESLIRAQVVEGLAGISAEQMRGSVIAYEPVWAIGTGVTATPQQAQDVHRLIRAILAELYGQSVADAVRIQYGGSVKPDNIGELLAQPDIDGALVGGASLQAESFCSMIATANSMR
ncbi:triose-phosphate isomerase [Candidatus Poribacteria bacterium]|nr:triose-phosphate isomerase [Candidatus Poribacteria bacterium]